MSGEQHKIVGIGFGIAGSYVAMKNGYTSDAIMIAIGSGIGCWLPDMDHDRTKLGRKRKAVTSTLDKIIRFGLYGGIIAGVVLLILMVRGFTVSTFDPQTLLIGTGSFIVILILKTLIEGSSSFKWATKHRGLMHTLIPLIPLCCLKFVSDYSLWVCTVYGLVLGYVSHLLADCTTTDGCPLFYPFSREPFRIPIFNTEKKQAAGAWILGVGAVLLACFLWG